MSKRLHETSGRACSKSCPELPREYLQWVYSDPPIARSHNVPVSDVPPEKYCQLWCRSHSSWTRTTRTPCRAQSLVASPLAEGLPPTPPCASASLDPSAKRAADCDGPRDRHLAGNCAYCCGTGYSSGSDGCHWSWHTPWRSKWRRRTSRWSDSSCFRTPSIPAAWDAECRRTPGSHAPDESRWRTRCRGKGAVDNRARMRC